MFRIGPCVGREHRTGAQGQCAYRGRANSNPVKRIHTTIHQANGARPVRVCTGATGSASAADGKRCLACCSKEGSQFHGAKDEELARAHLARSVGHHARKIAHGGNEVDEEAKHCIAFTNIKYW